MSHRNECSFLTTGVRKLSTKADTLLFAETIGLPGTGIMFLRTFRSKYCWEVRGSSVTRNLVTLSVIFLVRHVVKVS